MIQTPSLHPSFRFESPGGAPESPKLEAKPDVPVLFGPITLRAGIVEEIADEPGKIRPGTVTWSLAKSVIGEAFARGELQIGKIAALEISVGSRDPGLGGTVLDVMTRAGLGFEPAALLMPRLRRSSAAEGDPLLGRVQRRGAGHFRVELSDSPVDAANNVDRLTNRPWLDLIFRTAEGAEVIVTLEIGRWGPALVNASAARP